MTDNLAESQTETRKRGVAAAPGRGTTPEETAPPGVGAPGDGGGPGGWRRSGRTVVSRFTGNRLLVKVVSVLATLGLWHYIAKDARPAVLATPARVVEAGISLASSGEFWFAAASTARGILLGFLVAILLGIPIGLMAGVYKRADWATNPQITFVYVTPNIVFLPLFMLWFGLGFTVKIALVAFSAVLPIVIATREGARHGVSGIDVALVEGASEWQTMTKIVLPGTLPYIMTGLRLGLGRAMTGMIVAEMFTEMSGIGGLLRLQAMFFRTGQLMFTIFLIGMFGLFLSWMMKRFELHYAGWKFDEASST